MADLELQRSQMEIEYNSAIAQANATGNYELAQQLYQEKVRQDEALRQQIQWQAQQDLANQQMQFQQEQAGIGNQQWNQQFQNNQEQQKWGNMLDMAKQLAAYGDFSGYEALGYDTTQMRAEWEAEKQRQLSAGKSSSGSGAKSGMSLSTAKQAASAGAFDENVLAVLRANGYTDAMIEAIYGYRVPVEQGDKGPSVDINSVIALGYGPSVSPEYLAELEAAGVIESYVEGNKIKYRKTGNAAKPSIFG